MSKEKPHPLVVICANCQIIKNALLTSMLEVKHSLNPIPYNCPVARELLKLCPSGHDIKAIKEMHHEVNFVRR